MPTSVCPHCGALLPEIRDAFCGECRNRLDEPPRWDEAAKPLANGKSSFPFELVFGLLGAATNTGNGFLQLIRNGEWGKEDGAYLVGYLTGSALIGGFVGVLLGKLAAYLNSKQKKEEA